LRIGVLEFLDIAKAIGVDPAIRRLSVAAFGEITSSTSLSEGAIRTHEPRQHGRNQLNRIIDRLPGLASENFP